jgi:hypothetical protein
MVQSRELSVTPFCGICHGAVHVPLQCGNLSCTICQILGLLQLYLEAIVGDVLVWFLFLGSLCVLEDGPEVSHAEDHIRSLEGSDETFRIIKIRLDYFHALRLPISRSFGSVIATGPANFPARDLQIGIGNGTALNESQNISRLCPQETVAISPGRP